MAVLAGLVLCGCEQQNPSESTSEKTVRIGVVTPLSGPGKKSGENALLGIKTALKLQPRLKSGEKVELVVEDNNGDEKQTLNALEKLHDRQDVAGVLLMAKSDVALATTSLVEKLNIPVVSLIATHPDVTKNNRFVTQLVFDDRYQAGIAALYVRDEMLIDKVAVFSDPTNIHYSFLATEFIKKFTSVGGTVSEHITASPEAARLDKILERMRKSGVQLLYLAVPAEQVLDIARARNRVGWTPEMMGSDGLLAAFILQYPKDIALVNGMLATDFYSASLSDTEYGKKALQLFEKNFHEPETSYAALGCEGTSILLQAMERCEDKTDRLCINSMLRNTEKFEGLQSRITFHGSGKAERPVIMNIIKDEKMKFLIKVY